MTLAWSLGLIGYAALTAGSDLTSSAQIDPVTVNDTVRPGTENKPAWRDSTCATYTWRLLAQEVIVTMVIFMAKYLG